MEKYFELNAQQMNVFWLSQKASKFPLFNLCFEILYDAKINYEVFKSALEALVRNYDAFSIRIKMMNGIPIQEFNEKEEVILNFIDLENKKYGEEEIERLKGEEAKRKFTIFGEPLYRFTLIKVEKEKYLFLLNIHHIIADGLSIYQMRKNIINYYTKILNGDEISFNDEMYSYKKYIEAQNKFYQSEDYLNQERYWNNLKFYDDMDDQLTDKLRKSEQMFSGNNLKFFIDDNLFAELKRFSFKKRVPLSSVLMSAYFILLYKYSYLNNINIGFVSSGRQSIGANPKSIGLYSIIFPIGINDIGALTINELLSLVNERISRGIENQKVPLENILSRYNVKRGSSRQPLFQTVFNMQEKVEPLTGYAVNELYCKRIECSISQYELTLHVYYSKNQLEIELEYANDLFMEYKIRNMGRHYSNVLQSIVENSNKIISGIEVLDEAEKNQLVTLSFGKETKISEGSILELLEKNTDKWCDRTIVQEGDKKYSFEDIHRYSNLIAKKLKSMSASTGDTVAVIMHRSADLIAAMLGTLKAKAVYLPMDVNLPKDRLEYMLFDSNAKYAIISDDIYQSRKDILEVIKVNEILVLNEEFKKLNDKDYEELDKKYDCEYPSYIIYTSGSSGAPKGVRLNQKGILNLGYFFRGELGISEKDHIIQFFSIGFDASLWEMFMSLTTGACIHIVPDNIKFSFKKFTEFMNEHNITAVTLPPSFVASLQPDEIKYLKKLIVAGEASKYSELMRWKDKVTYINAYGPTEASICATWWNFKEACKAEVPIGRPIPNVQVMLVDNENNLVPVGVEGEIIISGAGLSMGYIDSSIEDCKKFILIPWLKRCFYKTGDRGKWTESGDILYLGRIDNQVKIRGYRVEIGEIESVLMQHEKVKNAAVKKFDTNDGEILAAYYEADALIDELDLKEYLLKILPNYMIPDSFHLIDKLPMTMNNKIDRKALPYIEVRRSSTYEPCDSEIEKRLEAVWNSILLRSEIGANKNFFDAGGNSLKLIVLSDKLRVEFNRDFELNDFFKYPTIKSFAQFIMRQDEKYGEDLEDFAEAESLLFSTIDLFGGSYEE